MKAKCHPNRPYEAKGLCHHCYHKEYRRTHLKNFKAYNRKHRAKPGQREKRIRQWHKVTKYKQYGITEKDFLAYKKAQKSLCAICKGKYKLVIDHDHNTDKVRGLLCDYCNTRLGWYEKHLNTIKDYLNETKRLREICPEEFKGPFK